MERFPSSTSKKESGVNRVIGVSRKDEIGLLEYFSDRFKNTESSDLFQEPDSEFQVIFEQIKKYLQKFLGEYGISTLDIPITQIKIVDLDQLPIEYQEEIQRKKTNAFYDPRFQRIVTFEKWGGKNRLKFLQIIIHEIIHVQAFESWQSTQKQGTIQLGRGEENINLQLRRVGFRIMSEMGDKVYFHDIDEAITTELTMRFDWEYFGKFPELQEELEERDKAISAFAKVNKTSIESERRHLAEIESEEVEEGKTKTYLRGYSYNEEREKLMRTCEDIFQKNKQQFSSSEEVFREFAKAAMTGKLLPIARIIEATYGKGSFRELGEGTGKSESSDILT